MVGTVRCVSLFKRTQAMTDQRPVEPRDKAVVPKLNARQRGAYERFGMGFQGTTTR